MRPCRHQLSVPPSVLPQVRALELLSIQGICMNDQFNMDATCDIALLELCWWCYAPVAMCHARVLLLLEILKHCPRHSDACCKGRCCRRIASNHKRYNHDCSCCGCCSDNNADLLKAQQRFSAMCCDILFGTMSEPPGQHDSFAQRGSIAADMLKLT